MPATPASLPNRDGHSGFDQVAEVLHPVLTPLGFAPGQAGAFDGAGQVTFCRGETDSPDGGCVDLVVDLKSTPDWRITDVRYWGFPRERWHLDFEQRDGLSNQLAGLAQTLPDVLI